MSEARRPARPRGGLPEDDDALRQLAASAFGGGAARLAAVPAPAAPAPQAPAPAAEAEAAPRPAETVPAAAAPAAAVPAPALLPAGLSAATPRPAEAAGGQAPVPASGPDQDFVTQATIQVGASVLTRFKAYQRSEERRTQVKPTNAEVIFRALDGLRGRYAEIVAARRPQLAEGRMFGRPVAGRRVAGTELRSQINYRPTVGERAAIREIWEAAGADSESGFINALLDEFLPAEPRAGRSPARR